MNEAFSFHVRKPIYLVLAAVSATLAILISPRIEQATASEFVTLAYSIFMVLSAIFLFIKAMRPIPILLLPDGLQIGADTFRKDEILLLAFNQRYRRITIQTEIDRRPNNYSLMRKADLPYVHQALVDWSKKTGIAVDLKDSWG